MKKVILLLAVVCVFALVSQSVVAGVILVSDPVFGADSVIRDTANGLDFLRLGFTDPHSYNSVLTELGSGGQFEGWSIASVADMEALIGSAGIINGSADAVMVAKVEELRDWFGSVRLTSTHERSRGMTTDAASIANTQTTFAIGHAFNVTPNEVFARVDGFAGKTATGENTYLTREAAPIPEPAGLGLIGLAMLGLKRRRA